jgi:hypothetical protein
MARSSLYTFAAAATLVLAACTEREPESTTGPEFAPTSTACGFSNSLVTGYFPSSRQAYMLTVKSSMASSAQDAQKRTYGFELMDSIGSVSRNTAFSIDPAAGAQLTIAIIGCIFPNNSFTYPTNALNDFTKALTSAAGGAYYVRGGGSTFSGRSATILGTTGGVAGNLSGIAPSTGSTAANWTSMLAGNSPAKPVDQGVLFYGYNAADPLATSVLYEWATVPSELTFNPAAIVSVCDDNTASNPVVHEEAVGVLFFVTSDICNTPQSLTMNEGWGPKALAARLGRVLADALMPATLQATMLITSGGGKTSTLPKSKFGKKNLDAVSSLWKDSPAVPTTTWYGTSKDQARPVSAYVSAEADGNPEAVRFCAYLSGANNNGTPTQLMKDPGPQQAAECTSPPNGDPKALSVVTTLDPSDETRAVADFGKVWVTKTGTITITLAVASGTSVPAASLSAVLYVKPLKK